MNYSSADTIVAQRRVAEERYTTAAFLTRLARMSPAARLEGYRYVFTPRQRTIWIAHYPDEVPLVNGEYEHIALALADLE